MAGTGTQGPPGDVEEGIRQLLRQRVRKWTRLTERIRTVREWLGALPTDRGPQPPGLNKVNDWMQDRKEESRYIFSALKERPGLADEVSKWGFTHDDFDPDDYRGSGTTPDAAQGGNEGPQPGGGGGAQSGGGGRGSGGSGSGGGAGGGGGGAEDIDHLPGKLGRDYHFVKGPNGNIKVVYNMDIPGPKKGSIAFGIPKELYDRYNVDPDKVKRLTAQQMERLEGFGPINEIKLRRGEHPFQSWMRDMKQKFGMAPSMLRDKEVMQTLYAAHLGKYDQAQLLGALQQTKWYDTKTKQRIDYLFKMGTADRKTIINSTYNDIDSYARQAFGGVDYTKHGLNEAVFKRWSTNVASGKTGWDTSEVQSRIDEIARGIEGTSLWTQEEQASEAGLAEMQEWEDIFETYRSQNIQWLGPNGRSSRGVITDWAKKRAAGTVSDGDYQQFIREQQKTLYPYITGDRSWEQFADPYRSALQRVMGDNASIGFDHKLLADLGAKDNSGVPTDRAMSLYDFNRYVRDPDRNPAAYEQGTALYDQGADRLAKLLNDLRGVA